MDLRNYRLDSEKERIALDENIRVLRAKNKLTLKELEELSGVDRNFISRIENCKSDTYQLMVIMKLAKVFNMSVEEIMLENSKYKEKIEHKNVSNEDIEIALKIVGIEIRKFRKNKKLTTDKLAKKVMLSPSYIREIEAGKKQATSSVIYRISRALDVPIDTLLYEKIYIS